jgi:hypothetical protein
MSVCSSHDDAGNVSPRVRCGCECRCGRERSGVTIVLAPMSLALTHPAGVVCLAVFIVCSQVRDAGEKVGVVATALKGKTRRTAGVLRRRAWFTRRPGPLVPVPVSCSKVNGRSAPTVGENALSLSRPTQDGSALPVGLVYEALGSGEFAADMCRNFAVRWVAEHPGAVESHGQGYAGFEFAECRAGKLVRAGDGGSPGVFAGVGGSCDLGAMGSVADGRHW